MSTQFLAALLLLEIAQALACLAALAETIRTLNECRRLRKKVLQTGENHGADVWTLNNVKTKWAFTAVQLFSLAMGVDRVGLLYRGFHADYWSRWIAFGLARTLISMIVAWVAWSNTKAFRKLRKSQ